MSEIVQNQYSSWQAENSAKFIYNGFIFVGKVDTDPQIEANQVRVYYIDENDQEVDLSQPIRTNSSGFPVISENNPTVIQVRADSDYSVKVLNRKGAQEWYIPKASSLSPVIAINHNDTLERDQVGAHDDIYIRTKSSPSELIGEDLKAGIRVKTKSRFPGWKEQNKEPRGGAEYDVVTEAEYNKIRNQNTSVLGKLDFKLNNNNYLLFVGNKPSLYNFGGISDANTSNTNLATDNTEAIKSILTFCIETGSDADFFCYNDGAFYQKDPIDLTDVTPYSDSLFLTIKGDKYRTDTPTWIMNDVSDVGLDLPPVLGLSLDRVSLTTNGNGRSSTTGKIGIRAATNTSSFRFNHNFVSVSEFSGAGFDYHDCLVCDIRGGNVVNNKTGYKFDLTFFAGLASTTINWRGTYIINNDVGIDAKKVSESLFMGVVFESNRIGMLNSSGIKNTFIGCYGENNTEFAYYDASGASAAFVNCFVKTLGDGFVCTGDTTSYGFDRIGSGYYDDRFAKTQKINFYDRSGNDAEGLSAQNASGEMQLIESGGTKKGKIPTSNTTGISGESRRALYQFILYDGVLVGNQSSPDGWVTTKNGIGDYKIDFPSAIRPPFIQITTSPLKGNATSEGQINIDHYLRIIDSAGSWQAFQNANGVQILTSVSGTATDAALFISVEVEI